MTTAGTIGWRDRVPGPRRHGRRPPARPPARSSLGKTNTPEFTWSDETDNDVYGRTSNPYDLDRTPGGSSGGAAAIVAAGGSPFDIGSDTGDSIRQPAHVCGIAGIKPTTGRVPRTGHSPGFAGIFQAVHPARTDRSARRGPRADPADHRRAGRRGSAHLPGGARRSATDVGSRGLRVALFTDNGVRTPTPATVDAVARRGVCARGRPGARVEQRRPPQMDQAADAWQPMISADGYAWLTRLITGAGTPGHGSYDTRGWVEFTDGLPGPALTALVERADRRPLADAAVDARHRVIVCPAMPQPAILHGGSNDPAFGDTYSDVHNLTGFPAVVVRGGTSPEGLPIGVQLVAGPWREDVALAAARVVEVASGGWRPPPS